MSGTWAGPAGPLAAFPAGARVPRLYAAVVFALALHAALFALRPGGVTGSHVAPAAKAMAVRVVRPPAAAEPAPPPPAERTPAPVAAPPERTSAAAAAQLPSAPAKTARERTLSGTAPAVRRATESVSERPPVATSAREPAPAVDARPPSAAMPSTAEAALPAAPDYAFGVRLDPGPRPLGEIEPEYPDPHLREGTVVLRLLISETGNVDNVAVVRSAPLGVFDQAALDAFGKARFSPGLAAGMPVKSQITVEVLFVPINRGARVSGRSY